MGGQEKWPENGRKNRMKSPRKKQSSSSSGRALSKTTALYWQKKAYLETKGDWASDHYHVRIQAHGVRRKVSLKATTKESAGREALEFYVDVLANGWKETVSEPTPGVTDCGGAALTTMGDWISQASPVSHARGTTVGKYAESLRTIVGEILDLKGARKPEAKSRINGFPVASLSKKVLQGWINTRLERLKLLDPITCARGQNTIRTNVRNSRALFSESIREAIKEQHGVEMEDPFAGLRLPKAQITRYTTRFSAELLLKTAAAELGGAPPAGGEEEAISRYEQWKILYLALVAGLRYNEIDKLRVRDICLDSGRISIRAHSNFQPKAAASEGDVLVGDTAKEVMLGMLENCHGEWFVREERSNRNKSYRTGCHHDRLLIWLRSYSEKGSCPLADVPKPLHELRKEAGNLVNNSHGLNEAKNFLRHANIAVTATYYVGTKGGITTGLG